MAAKKIKNNKEDVEMYMFNLDHPLKPEIETLRSIIKGASSKISERIKWNVPSYYFGDFDMAAFHLRHEEYIQLIFVFPKGIVTDGSGLLQGSWKDRREAKFFSMEDIESKKMALEKIVVDWLALIANN